MAASAVLKLFAIVAFSWSLFTGVTCIPLTHMKISSHNNSLFVQDVMRLSKAAEMRNFMNESVDPCTDFYSFACGNWAKINPVDTTDALTTGLFQVMSTAFDHKVERLLKAGPEADDTFIDRKVKDFYASCTKIGTQVRSGDYQDELFDIIEEFGEMPALTGGTWKQEGFDWLETVAKISRKYGKSIILTVDILPDYAKNTVNRPYIGHPELPLESKSMYVDAVTALYRNAYKEKVAKDCRQYLGMSDALSKQTADDIVEFEIMLAQGMVDEKLGLGIGELSKLTTVADLQLKYAPTIDFKKLVNITLGEAYNEPVYEYVEDYQKNLVSIINSTSKHIVANYIFYSLAEQFFPKVGETPAKQAKNCIETTKKHFAKNLDNMIYRRYNNDVTERDINLIWNELKQTFRTELFSEKLNWITRGTRYLAIDKLNAMRLEINSYKDTNFIEEFGALQVDRDHYLSNLKNVLEHNKRKEIAKLHEKPKPIEAGEVLSYTPANIILENVVKVPVSLLQPNYLWAANYPNALKFGTLGTLIGHELIHGFDDNGRRFDKNGNHVNWWDAASSLAFNMHTQCFVDQYSQYTYGGRNLPRSTSQSENIADNGGVRIAYASYLRWLQEAERSSTNLYLETLPTMDYTSKQLFFISYAQIWCNAAHPFVQNLQTSLDTHVPGKYRVIGPLSNFPEFSKEFNCAKDAPMNANRKCEIY